MFSRVTCLFILQSLVLPGLMATPVFAATTTGHGLPNPCASRMDQAQFGGLIAGRAAHDAVWAPLLPQDRRNARPTLTPLLNMDGADMTGLLAIAASRGGFALTAHSNAASFRGLAFNAGQGRSSSVAAARGLQLISAQAGSAVVPLPFPFWLLLAALIALRGRGCHITAWTHFQSVMAYQLVRRRRSNPAPISAPRSNKPVAGNGTVGTLGIWRTMS